MKKILIIFIIILSCLNISRGVILSQKNSSDFQWSPSKLFFSGQNHYEYIIQNKDDYKKEGKIILTQNGEYAHGLYVIFYPLQKLSFESAKFYWLIFNLILISIILIILVKKNNLTINQTILYIPLCLSSIPFSSHLKLGQQTLFMLLFFILPFFYKGKIFSILSGLSYFKYNIGYALFLRFLIKKEYLNLTLSLIPICIGFLFYFFYVETNFVSLIFQPFKIASIVTTDSVLKFDLFTILSRIFQNIDSNFFLIFKYLFIVLLNIFFIHYSKEIKNNLYNLSFISVVILYCSPHWSHDHILLFPLLLFSIKNISNIYSKINLVLILYFLFINKIIDFVFFDRVGNINFSYFNFIILTALILNNFLLTKLNKKNPQKFLSEGSNFV